MNFSIPSVMNYLMFGFYIVIGILLIMRFFRNRYSRPVSVPAKVVDLYQETHTEYRGQSAPRNVTDFTAAFDRGGEVLKFSVEVLAYQGLHKGEKGILTYRGTHFVEFKRAR